MRPAILFAALLLTASLGTSLLAADGPTPYPDAKNEAAWPGKGPIRVFDWMVQNRAAFWKQREQAKGSVVFIGDSLTAGWKDLAAAFPNLRIANRGIGGDTSRGLLFRFKEDALDLEPKAISLCIGGNDLSAHGDPAAVVANIATMVEQARARYPELPFVLYQTPPRDNPKAPMKPGAQADLNRRIAEFGATKERIVVVDLFTALGDADGKVIPENFAQDRLHIAGPGYAKWAEAVKPAFEKLGVR